MICIIIRGITRPDAEFIRLCWTEDFSCRMRFLSSLLKRRRLTAAFSFMKALALLRLVVKVRPFCSRGSATVVEEGVPDSDLIVLHVPGQAGAGAMERSVAAAAGEGVDIVRDVS